MTGRKKKKGYTEEEWNSILRGIKCNKCHYTLSSTNHKILCEGKGQHEQPRARVRDKKGRWKRKR